MENEICMDRIAGFHSDPHHINVTFFDHAGIYRLPVSREDFVKQMGLIAEAFKSDEEIRIELCGDEILRVGPE